MTPAAIFSVYCDDNLTYVDADIRKSGSLLTFDERSKNIFLLQEINRETNTIGSKANDVKITNVVLKLKNEIEKIREQAQNIE